MDVLVCHCHRVNDRVIREAARAGARCREDVAAACRAGSACGGCRPTIDRLLENELQPNGASLPVIRAAEPGT